MIRKLVFWKNEQAFTLIELLVIVTLLAILAVMISPALQKAREQSKTTLCQNNLRQINIAFQMYRREYEGMNPPGYYLHSPGYRTRWYTLLYNLTQNHDIFICPSRPEWSPTHPDAWEVGLLGYAANRYICPHDTYTYVKFPVRDSEITDPEGTVLVSDMWYSGGRKRYWKNFDLEPSCNITDSRGDWFLNFYWNYALAQMYNQDEDAAKRDRERHNGGLNYLYYDGHVEWHRAEYIYENEKALFNPQVEGPSRED